MAHHQETGSDFKVGLAALGLGLVWLFIVGAIAHFLAI